MLRRSPGTAVRLLWRAAVLLFAVQFGCTPAADDPDGAFMRGTISNGRGLFFRACGQEAMLPLTTANDILRDVVEGFMAGGAPIYAEITGRIGGRVPTATTTRVLFAARETSGCDGPEPAFDLRAQGNEPFWSLELTGTTAVWSTPEDLPGSSFAVNQVQQIGDGWLIESAEVDRTLRVSFAATGCRDTMADSWFGYTVEADLDGTLYRGCGRGTR